MELLPTQLGPYRIEDEIGRGQTVVVFRAHDTLYDRPVALKIFPPYHPSNQPESVRTFISEGREGMRLRHPNIIQTYDAGLTDGYHYIAQELAAVSLEEMLDAPGDDIPVAASIELLEQIGAGLDYAHELGVIHGALMPANILLTTEGQPLLTNFDFEGRRRSAIQANLSPSSTEHLAYLSAEQAKGSLESDSRGDIYALGVLAYRLLTGELPYQGDNVLSLLHAITSGALETPSIRKPDLPPGMDSVLLQALEQTPSHRWKTAGAFVNALGKASRGQSVTVPLHTGQADGPFTDNSPAMQHSDEHSDEHVSLAGGNLPAPSAVVDVSIHANPMQATLAQTAVGYEPDAMVLPSGYETSVDYETTTETSLQPIVKQAPKHSTKMTPLVGARVVSTKIPQAKKGRSDKALVWTGVMVGLTAAALLLMAGLTLMRGAEWRTILTNDSKSPSKGQQEIVAPALDGIIDDAIGSEEQIGGKDTESTDSNQSDHTKLTQSIGRKGAKRTGAGKENLAVEGIESDTKTPIDLSSASLDDLEPLPLAILISTATALPKSTVPNPTVPATDIPTDIPTEVPTLVPTNSPIPEPTSVPPTSVPEPQSQVVLVSTNGDESATQVNSEPTGRQNVDSATGGEGAGGEASEIENPEGEARERPALFGRIAYAIWNQNSLALDTYIYVIGSGVSPTPLMNKRQPDFRADGWLAFNGEGGGLDNIMRTQSEGQNGVVISAHPEDSRPHWSPTGKQFVFDSTLMGDRRHRIYLSNDIDETENEVAGELKPIMYDFWELLGRHPIFLGDGQIAYQGCNVWLNGGSCGIYRINGVGSEPQQITYWPNDIPTDNLGTDILFMSNREENDNGDNWDVYQIRPDGSELLRLTGHPAHDGLATASPDGNYIAFVSDRDGPWAVYVMDADGRNQEKLFELNGQFGPGAQYWQYDWKQERLSWGN